MSCQLKKSQLYTLKTGEIFNFLNIVEYVIIILSQLIIIILSFIDLLVFILHILNFCIHNTWI